MHRFRALLVCSLWLSLTACHLLRGSKEAPPIKGERVSILAHERTVLRPETNSHITLPPMKRNQEWISSPKVPHLEISEFISPVWRKQSLGRFSRRDHMLVNLVVDEGRIYLLDTQAVVYAFDSLSGNNLWKTTLRPRADRFSTRLTGGLASDGKGRLVVTTGWGHVVALRSNTGTRLWCQSVGDLIPMRAAPTISESLLFIVNRENEIRALEIESGEELWYRRGVAEITTFLKGASPSVENRTVVVALASGEIVALRAENGKQMWNTFLLNKKTVNTIKNFTDIIAQPLIRGWRVYVVNHSGLMASLNLKSGEYFWKVEIGTYYTPIVCEKSLFVLTTDDHIVALDARSGSVIWITELPHWKNPDRLEKRISWTGPILAGERLVVVSLDGKIVVISPYTGSLLGESELEAEILLPPVVADGKVYFLTHRGELIAYQ